MSNGDLAEEDRIGIEEQRSGLILELWDEVERLREDNEKLRELLRSIRIDGPDFEGLVWVSFVSQGLAARAHVVVGEENRMASRVALRFKELRRAALEAKP